MPVEISHQLLKDTYDDAWPKHARILTSFLSHQLRPYGPTSRSNWTRGVQLLIVGGGGGLGGVPSGPIASRGVSVPVFLRKRVATCDSPGVGSPDPPAPSGFAHAKVPAIAHLAYCY